MLFRVYSKEAASHCHQTKKEQLRKYLFQQQYKLMQPLAPGPPTDDQWWEHDCFPSYE